jgi:hypothetical protein
MQSKRLFTGLAGSALAVVTDNAPQAKPKNTKQKPPKDSVLAHFCFDQERNETKPIRCDCSLRITRKTAYTHTDAKRADWLLCPNPKTSELVKNHRAIVVRRAVIEGEVIFALTPPQKAGRVDGNVTALTVLRNRVRAILQKLVSRGVFPATALESDNDTLNAVLNDPSALLKRLSAQGQNRFHKEVADICRSWETLKAKIPSHEVFWISGGFNGRKLDQIRAAVERDKNGTRRASGANFVPRKFNGGYIYNAGQGADADEHDASNPDDRGWDPTPKSRNDRESEAFQDRDYIAYRPELEDS